MDNPKADKKKQNRRSQRQERKVAQDVGGRVQAGSGSSWRARGDVRTPDELLEVKYTDKASRSLKVSELKQIKHDALMAGKTPGMIVDFEQHGIRAIIYIEEL